MQIHNADGSVVSIPLNEIDSIKHEADSFPPTIDGYTYQTVTIGTQVWFAENLRTSEYANGDTIPNINGVSSTSGAWSWYNNNSSYENTNGKLYNWYAVSDIRNVCPTGWHVPTDTEWSSLSLFFGGETVAGSKLKSTSGWGDGNNGTNESGLSMLPGGYFDNGQFIDLGYHGHWWSSTENDESNAWYHSLRYFNGNTHRNSYNKGTGFSVRCLRD